MMNVEIIANLSSSGKRDKINLTRKKGFQSETNLRLIMIEMVQKNSETNKLISAKNIIIY